MGRMPLYPSADQLIANNYPPLSFYIVGAFGRLIGDPVLAGRLLSLAAVLAIAAAIFRAIRLLGGDRTGGCLGAAYFVATLSHFCVRYVGMDDPQLLAQGVMTFSFVGFLAATRRNSETGYLIPILAMAAAGFIKHNILAMPLTACLWLLARRPRVAIKCFGIAVGAIIAGFAVCHAVYGPDFLANMLLPRRYSWSLALNAFGPLKRLDVALASFLLIAWLKRRDWGMRLSALLIVIGLILDIVEYGGEGVDVNSEFDLLIGLSMGLGAAFSHLGNLPRPRLLRPEAWQAALLVALAFRLLPSHRLTSVKAVRLFWDPSLQTEIAIREKAMAMSVAQVRGTPGDVRCSNLVCYRSGKPFAMDSYTTGQRIIMRTCQQMRSAPKVDQSGDGPTRRLGQAAGRGE